MTTRYGDFNHGPDEPVCHGDLATEEEIVAHGDFNHGPEPDEDVRYPDDDCPEEETQAVDLFRRHPR